MNKFYCTLIILMAILSANAQNLILTNESRSNLSIELNVNKYDIKELHDRGEVMHEIVMDNISLPNDEGKPNIPFVNRFIAVPEGAELTINIENCEREIIQGVNIAPSKGYFLENEGPKPDIRKDDDIYSKNEFYPSDIVTLSKPYSLRGLNATGLTISPVQWNPVTKELIIYKKISFTIDIKGGKGSYGDEKYRSVYWDPIYERNILNYNSLPKIDYGKRMQEWLSKDLTGAEYIIIIPNDEDFRPQAERLANFRRQQGIITEVYSLSDIGVTSSNELMTWFHNMYNTWDIPAVAACLFGDHEENTYYGIPAMDAESYWDFYVSDNYYGDINNDKLPDICMSRLVASNAEEAEMFIDRQLDYEYFKPNMDEDFYKRVLTACGYDVNAWFQMCSESIGGYLRSIGKETTRINGAYSYYYPGVWSQANYTDFIVNYFGPDGLGYFPETPEAAGGFEGGTGQDVINAINEGTFLVQHRDHGWDRFWYQPDFDISQLSMLDNADKIPYLITVNCRTGNFSYGQDCLAEGFLRASNSESYLGAVGALAPSAQSYSFANDTYLWGVWDFFENSFMPEHGTETSFNNNYMPAFANVAGKYFLSQMAFPNYDNDMFVKTCEIYHAHNDAFLRLYSEVPQVMDVEHTYTITIEDPAISIKAPENCMISIYLEENETINILASVPSTGNVQNIALPDDVVVDSKLNITVSGQNYLRYENFIYVIEDETAYMTLSDYIFDSDNTELNYNDETYINLTLTNIGNHPTSDVNIDLQCDNELISISENNNHIEHIDVNESVELDDAFFISVEEGLEDDTKVKFTITYNHDDVSYSHDFYVNINSPKLEVISIEGEETEGDGNSIVDPGDFAKFRFTVVNNSEYSISDINAKMISNDGFMRVITDSISIDKIDVGELVELEFEAYVEWNVGVESMLSIRLNLDFDSYNLNKDFNYYVGTIIEDFENSNISSMWDNNFAAPWVIDDVISYSGSQSLRSGSIGHDETTDISTTHYSPVDYNISFYYKVSTEDSYDFFKFYIDGELKNTWSGNVEWSLAEYEVEAGTHTYRWEYTKDFSESSGNDCVWIDYVWFPPSYDNVETVEAKEDLYIFPNPAYEHINIVIDDEISRDAQINIYNMMNIKVLEQKFNDVINVSHLNSGIYFVEIISNQKRYIQKIIIER